MVIQEAGEMYLETILKLQYTQGYVRAVDVAREMGYSKPTVSEQMKKFREHGYVELDGNGHLKLTDMGLKIAQDTLEKHNVMSTILKKMGVSEEIAAQDACRLEHYISEETFVCFKKYFGIGDDTKIE